MGKSSSLKIKEIVRRFCAHEKALRLPPRVKWKSRVDARSTPKSGSVARNVKIALRRVWLRLPETERELLAWGGRPICRLAFQPEGANGLAWSDCLFDINTAKWSSRRELRAGNLFVLAHELAHVFHNKLWRLAQRGVSENGLTWAEDLGEGLEGWPPDAAEKYADALAYAWGFGPEMLSLGLAFLPSKSLADQMKVMVFFRELRERQDELGRGLDLLSGRFTPDEQCTFPAC